METARAVEEAWVGEGAVAVEGAGARAREGAEEGDEEGAGGGNLEPESMATPTVQN